MRSSLLVELSDELQRLLVRDDALVGLLEFKCSHDVDVCLRALFEASRKCHFVKQVGIERNIPEVVLAASGNE